MSENNCAFNSTDHGNEKYARILLDSTIAKNYQQKRIKLSSPPKTSAGHKKKHSQ